MKTVAAALALASSLFLPPTVLAQEAELAPLVLRDMEANRDVGRVLEENDFRGHYAFTGPSGPVVSSYELAPESAQGDAEPVWPWASITKQIIAVMIMQQVEDGTMELDALASSYMPGLEDRNFTVRNLLQHQTDLPNPNRTPRDGNGIPEFYTADYDPLDFCLASSVPREDGRWSYNNCDFILLGALLEAVTGQDIQTLIDERIGTPSDWQNTRFTTEAAPLEFVGVDSVYRQIDRFGSSAALVGPLSDLLRFDRALLDGELLGEEAMAALWDANPQLGYMALGQWVFQAPLAGCEEPVTIVERRGGIVKYQARNFILPDYGISIALSTDQGDFIFGEIWQGEGAMFDMLSAAVCN